MPDVEISIGGRLFQVACQAGEEHFLRSAAAMLDSEAQPLVAQMGRLPEVRLLLMSGLMLADRTAALEDEVRALKARLEAIADQPIPPPQRIEVPVIPPELELTMADIAERAEALAARLAEDA